MKEAEIIAFATPVDYCGMGSQLKTLLDRAISRFISDNQFRSIYLPTFAIENDVCTEAGTIKGINGWISCFDGVQPVGAVFMGGVTAPGDIAEHPSLTKAYKLGLSIH